MDGKIDNKQFGGISGTSTTDVLLEMVGGMNRLTIWIHMSALLCYTLATRFT